MWFRAWGKGLAASSIGCLLEARGMKVQMMKLDPYINVDPGTMSPFQHGEVFVTDDGAETDLDLGHYERFTQRASDEGEQLDDADEFIFRSSKKNGAAIIWARRFRSFRTSPTKSRKPPFVSLPIRNMSQTF